MWVDVTGAKGPLQMLRDLFEVFTYCLVPFVTLEQVCSVHGKEILQLTECKLVLQLFYFSVQLALPPLVPVYETSSALIMYIHIIRFFRKTVVQSHALMILTI
jgi:hypothetical protein